uniref:Uncharacterized protein n=1 Tax=Populus trichocarpa TaxID=3694 RepID=A0A3N7FWV9_POPTR
MREVCRLFTCHFVFSVNYCIYLFLNRERLHKNWSNKFARSRKDLVAKESMMFLVKINLRSSCTRFYIIQFIFKYTNVIIHD